MIADSERHVLRLRMWPFYEFAIEFSDVRLDETALWEREAARVGTFKMRSRVQRSVARLDLLDRAAAVIDEAP